MERGALLRLQGEADGQRAIGAGKVAAKGLQSVIP